MQKDKPQTGKPRFKHTIRPAGVRTVKRREQAATEQPTKEANSDVDAGKTGSHSRKD